MALPQLNAPIHKTILPVSGTEVKFRPFLVKEEKLMIIADSTGEQADIEDAVQQVVSNCTMGLIDSDNLIQTDLEWLLLQIRCRSKGFTTELVFRCVNPTKHKQEDGSYKTHDCNFRNEITADLKTVKVVGGNSKELIQLTDDIGMKMKTPSIGMIRVIERLEESDVEKTQSIIMASIDSIYTKDEMWFTKDLSREELSEFLESFTKDQFDLLKQWADDVPKLKLEVDYMCMKCGATDKITIEGIDSFFG